MISTMLKRAIFIILIIGIFTNVNGASWQLGELRHQNGGAFDAIDGPTVIKIGPDFRYYVGSKGYVTALSVDIQYRVVGTCVSHGVGTDRTVLGMAFDPRYFKENDIFMYIATSTLNWGGGKSGNPNDVPGGWKNGKVQIMRSNISGHCLTVTKDLVTGLPVSNHDHGVNGLQIGLNGRLYVLSGGMTNAGHSELGDGDGGSPANPLSGALLEVNHNIPNFNGDVVYDSDNGRIANIIGSPNVIIFSSGLMNAFGIELHSNSQMYMVDNGPNPGYGKESTSCTTNLETEPHFPDKFLRVRKGAWYGHPNRNRGRSDAKQCTFQHIGKNAPGQEPELEEIEASTNGITEYSANVLGANYKGAMCFSRIGFGDLGNSFSLFLNKNGTGVTKREGIRTDAGGLDITMDRYGSLITTDYIRSRFKILIPVPEGPAISSKVAVYSVFPRFGQAKGGNKIWITGKFAAGGISVMLGSRICSNVKRLNRNLITCNVPRGNPRTKAHVSVTIEKEISPIIGTPDYTYMELEANSDLLSHLF